MQRFDHGVTAAQSEMASPRRIMNAPFSDATSENSSEY